MLDGDQNHTDFKLPKQIAEDDLTSAAIAAAAE
jgi:hypothetical protein